MVPCLKKRASEILGVYSSFHYFSPLESFSIICLVINSNHLEETLQTLWLKLLEGIMGQTKRPKCSAFFLFNYLTTII